LAVLRGYRIPGIAKEIVMAPLKSDLYHAVDLAADPLLDDTLRELNDYPPEWSIRQQRVAEAVLSADSTRPLDLAVADYWAIDAHGMPSVSNKLLVLAAHRGPVAGPVEEALRPDWEAIRLDDVSGQADLLVPPRHFLPRSDSTLAQWALRARTPRRYEREWSFLEVRLGPRSHAPVQGAEPGWKGAGQVLHVDDLATEQAQLLAERHQPVDYYGVHLLDQRLNWTLEALAERAGRKPDDILRAIHVLRLTPDSAFRNSGVLPGEIRRMRTMFDELPDRRLSDIGSGPARQPGRSIAAAVGLARRIRPRRDSTAETDRSPDTARRRRQVAGGVGHARGE
jgi:hypothetical protein